MGSSKVSIRAKLKNIFHKAPDTNADLQVDRKEDEYRKGAALASISSLNKSRPQSEFHDHDNKSVVMAHNGPYDGKTEDPQSLWDRAYDALDPRLVAKYEKLLSRQIPSTGREVISLFFFLPITLILS